MNVRTPFIEMDKKTMMDRILDLQDKKLRFLIDFADSLKSGDHPG